MSAVADKLDEARALIERGRTDAADAVWATAPGNIRCIDPQFERCLGAIRYLERAIGAPSLNNCALAGWNDAPGRTQAEVIDAFKRAAELARAGDQ